MLAVRTLRKTYRHGWGRGARRISVLDGVDFRVAPGEIVGLLGANGAGKTTILHAIAGLLRPDGGCVDLDGSPLTPERATHEVALCSSADRSFYYRLSFRENLQFFARLQGLRGQALAVRVRGALETTGLQEVADRRYSRCSTGMRQRLSFARAALGSAGRAAGRADSRGRPAQRASSAIVRTR